jgi:ankyrin repeat protein
MSTIQHLPLATHCPLQPRPFSTPWPPPPSPPQTQPHRKASPTTANVNPTQSFRYENRPDHLKAFLTACSEGDLETVRTLVENENVDIETKSMSGAPGVFFAAQGGFVPVLEYLNDRDANFKASDFGGSTPFHEASRKGHPDAIEFMCSMAAGRVDIHKTDGQVRPMRYALVRVIHVQPTRLGRIGANILQSTSLDRLSVWVNRDGMR